MNQSTFIISSYQINQYSSSDGGSEYWHNLNGKRYISTYWKCKNIYTPYSIILIPRVYLKEKKNESIICKIYLIVYLNFLK